MCDVFETNERHVLSGGIRASRHIRRGVPIPAERRLGLDGLAELLGDDGVAFLQIAADDLRHRAVGEPR